jgi:hypothetical protein
VDSEEVIAERKLLYSSKGQNERRQFAIQISAPSLTKAGSKPFPMDEGAASCGVHFEGLEGLDFEVHGIDAIHALAQATNIDEYLRPMTTKYDFYWLSGDPYFEGT